MADKCYRKVKVQISEGPIAKTLSYGIIYLCTNFIHSSLNEPNQPDFVTAASEECSYLLQEVAFVSTATRPCMVAGIRGMSVSIQVASIASSLMYSPIALNILKLHSTFSNCTL